MAPVVAEIVSPDRPARDLVQKRGDYADAKFPIIGSWIRADQTVAVLSLRARSHVEHGVFSRGDKTPSASFDGLVADAGALFDAASAR